MIGMQALIQYLNDFVYLYPLLMSFVWMIGAIIFYTRHERKQVPLPELKEYPFFSILIPCRNEEKQIKETIQQLLDQDYPTFEILAIDDGSQDQTTAILHELCRKHSQVRALYLKKNQGKGAALTLGCLAARGELILCIDADALLDDRALRWMAWHFVHYPRVGAITGNPRVLNRTALLGKIQTGEYSTIIGLIKRTQRILGKVLTVSGVVAAFRKRALVSVGFWDPNMVTEDIDITWKLEKQFWDVRYEPRAICWIRVPETLRGLWKQRLRWAQGGVEVMKKHLDIWKSWKQRRLWPVHLEYITSTLWAYTFWLILVFWGIQELFQLVFPVVFKPPIPPRWTGSILALACIIQFVVSIYVDKRYEKKFFKYLFWVIWFPFLYWMINALALTIAAPKALLKKRGTPAIWESPDRGLDKL